MLFLKWLLTILGVSLFGSAGALVVYDIYLSAQLRCLLGRALTDLSGAEVPQAPRPFGPIRWGGSRSDWQLQPCCRCCWRSASW